MKDVEIDQHTQKEGRNKMFGLRRFKALVATALVGIAALTILAVPMTASADTHREDKDRGRDLPDLRCEILVYDIANDLAWVPNGETAGYAGVEVKALNTGNAPASNFSFKILVNGSEVVNQNMSLGAGQHITKYLDVHPDDGYVGPDHPNSIFCLIDAPHAKIIANKPYDNGGVIDESNELNNWDFYFFYLKK